MTSTEPSFRDPVVSGTPIAVYQMGKVGSRTIVTALEKMESPDSVHHLHLLSAGAINACRTESMQLGHSRALRTYLDAASNQPINVITAVREPVAQQLSELFQTLERRQPQLIDQNGQWNEGAICEFFQKQIAQFDHRNDRMTKWFENEFHQALGIRIFDHPFNHDKGHITISNGQTRVLVLRLENIENWPAAIENFLQLNTSLEFVRTNSASQKPYEHTYRNVKQQLELSSSSLQTIYSTVFCKHFYTDQMLDKFIARWSKRSAVAA